MLKLSDSELKRLDVVYTLVVAKYALVKGLNLEEAARRIDDDTLLYEMGSEGIDRSDIEQFIAVDKSEEFATTIRKSTYYDEAVILKAKNYCL